VVSVKLAWVALPASLLLPLNMRTSTWLLPISCMPEPCPVSPVIWSTLACAG
jgi:hypothetical protein